MPHGRPEPETFVTRREFEAFRVRNKRALLVAAIAGALGAVLVYSAIDDIEGDASFAQMNAMNALNQANNATSQAHQANVNAQQALAQSRSRRGADLPASPQFPPVVRSGEVTAVTGAAPAAVGDSCVVTVISRNGGNSLNCQVGVRCGGTSIYGGGSLGYLVCGIKDGEPTYGRDEDTGADPMLELNLADDRVVVSDGPDPAYAVTITLAEL